MERYADICENRADLNDIQLAARSKVAVLITAPPDDALEITQVIAGHRGWSADLLVCDFGAETRQRPRLPEAETGSRHPRILLLREVHALSPSQQAQLMELLEDGDRQVDAPRIIASSSVSLFNRVREGSFDERLFYRLNAIHLIVQTMRGSVAGHC